MLVTWAVLDLQNVFMASLNSDRHSWSKTGQINSLGKTASLCPFIALFFLISVAKKKKKSKKLNLYCILKLWIVPVEQNGPVPSFNHQALLKGVGHIMVGNPGQADWESKVHNHVFQNTRSLCSHVILEFASVLFLLLLKCFQFTNQWYVCTIGGG